jgi:hypothetical protein
MDTKTEKRQSVAGNRHWGGNTAELPNYEANAGHAIVVYAKFLSGCDPEVIPRVSRDRSRRCGTEIPRDFGIKSGSRPLSPLDFRIEKKNIFEFRM